MTAPAAAAGQQSAAAFGDPARVDAAHAVVRTDSSIQFDFPWRKPEINEPPRWLIELFDALGRFVQWVGGGWKLLMWVAIAVVVAALVLALFPTLREWLAARLLRRGETAAKPVPAWAPEAGAARALLDEADRLAASGRYAEAVRLILHRSIEDIEKWRGDSLRPSLTSRDIAKFEGAAFERLPDAARTVFGRIVADVERSLFGGNPLGEADWTRARDDYAGFALGR